MLWLVWVGHLNVHHRNNKVPDVCTLLLSQSSPDYHLFEITESRLKFRITDHSISIPDFYIIKRDPQLSGQTGIRLCVCASVYPDHYTQTQRPGKLQNRMHLARFEAACAWVTIVCYLYRNPAYDSFAQILCWYLKVNRADVLVFGDFNIDMLEPHSCWVSTLFALVQLISHYSNPHE